MTKKLRTKSFSGCWTCRKRRTKCDEKKPTCNTCKQEGVKCLGFSVRLCWDHSKGDNSRRTVIYNHSKYKYMNKSLEEIEIVLSKMDNPWLIRGDTSQTLPFSLFKLNTFDKIKYTIKSEKKNTLEGINAVDEESLIYYWIKVISPTYISPIKLDLDTKEKSLSNQGYIDYIKMNLFSEMSDRESFAKTALRHSILSSSLIYLSKTTYNKMQPQYFNLGIKMLFSTLSTISTECTTEIEDLCLLLTALVNLMFFYTSCNTSIAQSYNADYYLKIGINILTKINQFYSKVGTSKCQLYGQISYLNHIIKYTSAIGFTLNPALNLNPQILTESNNFIIKNNTVLVVPYNGCQVFYEIVAAVIGHNRCSVKMDKLEFRMLFFKFEDELLNNKSEFLHLERKTEGDKLLFHISHIFYAAVYIYFLRECFPEISNEKSIEIMVNYSLAHIDAAVSLLGKLTYNPGIIWPLLIIGLESKNADSKLVCISYLNALKKFNLDSVEIILATLEAIWSDCENTNKNKVLTEKILTCSGFGLLF